MAHSTLPSLTHPSFPQVFEAATAQLVSRLVPTFPQLSDVLDAAEARLGECDWNDPESRYGACDGGSCHQDAVVHHLQSELEYCLQHFQKAVRRG
jgi:hypothetical protein